MILPQVDRFREPFIVPLGHLTLAAAQCELALSELIATSEIHPEFIDLPCMFTTAVNSAALGLRRAGEKKFTNIKRKLVSVCSDNDRADMIEAIDSYYRLKEKRNRAIHDAIQVGITDEDEVVPLRISHQRRIYSVEHITPDDIASLAYELFVLTSDLNALTYRLKRYRQALHE